MGLAITAVGTACTLYFLGSIAQLARSTGQASTSGPRARDARTGRPLRMRVDRRGQARRTTDKRSAR